MPIRYIAPVYFLLLLHFTVAQAQQKDTMHTPPIDFSQINTYQLGNFKGKDGKDGKDGNSRLFVIKLWRMALRGKNGKNGADGPNLYAYITAIPIADSVILKVDITNLSDKKKTVSTFYVNPGVGHLNVFSIGGKGGDGGNGATGLPKEDKKSATDGGDAGNGANGGNAGTIKVVAEDAAITYLKSNYIAFYSQGGAPGKAGKGGEPLDKTLRAGTDGHEGQPGDMGARVELVDTKGKVYRVF